MVGQDRVDPPAVITAAFFVVFTLSLYLLWVDTVAELGGDLEEGAITYMFLDFFVHKGKVVEVRRVVRELESSWFMMKAEGEAVS